MSSLRRCCVNEIADSVFQDQIFTSNSVATPSELPKQSPSASKSLPSAEDFASQEAEDKDAAHTPSPGGFGSPLVTAQNSPDVSPTPKSLTDRSSTLVDSPSSQVVASSRTSLAVHDVPGLWDGSACPCTSPAAVTGNDIPERVVSAAGLFRGSQRVGLSAYDRGGFVSTSSYPYEVRITAGSNNTPERAISGASSSPDATAGGVAPSSGTAGSAHDGWVSAFTSPVTPTSSVGSERVVHGNAVAADTAQDVPNTPPSPCPVQPRINGRSTASRTHRSSAASFKPVPPPVEFSAPRVLPDTAFGIFERAAEGTAGPEFQRISGRIKGSTSTEGIEQPAATAVDDPKSSLAKSSNSEDFADSAVVECHIATIESEWQAALESKERSYKDDIEDLKDAHADELKDLQRTIADLECEVQKVKKRKEAVAKAASNTNKKLAVKENDLKTAKQESAAKDEELAYQEGILNTALADNDAKERELDVARETIVEKEVIQQNDRFEIHRLLQELDHANNAWSELRERHSHVQEHEVNPLAQEVARLTSENRLCAQYTSVQAAQIANLEDLLRSRSDVSGLRAQLAQVAGERDDLRTQLLNNKQYTDIIAKELQGTRIEVSNYLARLRGYAAEHEDFPALGAHTDNLLTQKDERYRALEKTANRAYREIEDLKKHHKHEEIMLKARNENLQDEAINLERRVVLAENQVAQWASAVHEYVGEAEATFGPDEGRDVLRKSLEASQETVDDFKLKLKHQGGQLAHVQGSLAEQRKEVRIRDLLLEDKEAALQKAMEESKVAQQAIDLEQWKSETAMEVLKEELEAKDQELRTANDRSYELSEDLNSAVHSDGSPYAVHVAASRRTEIDELREQVQQLEAEKLDLGNKLWSFQVHNGQSDPNDQDEVLKEVARQQDWQRAQDEIARLNRRVEILGPGCDPDKFKIAEERDKLEKEKETLEQQHKHQQEAHKTAEEHHAEQSAGDFALMTAATKKLKDARAQIQGLAELGVDLAGHLGTAWFAGSTVDQEMAVEDRQRGARREQYISDVMALFTATIAALRACTSPATAEHTEVDSSDYTSEEVFEDAEEEETAGAVARDESLDARQRSIGLADLPEPTIHGFSSSGSDNEYPSEAGTGASGAAVQVSRYTRHQQESLESDQGGQIETEIISLGAQSTLLRRLNAQFGLASAAPSNVEFGHGFVDEEDLARDPAFANAFFNPDTDGEIPAYYPGSEDVGGADFDQSDIGSYAAGAGFDGGPFDADEGSDAIRRTPFTIFEDPPASAGEDGQFERSDEAIDTYSSEATSSRAYEDESALDTDEGLHPSPLRFGGQPSGCQ